jgi:hypothetical protein
MHHQAHQMYDPKLPLKVTNLKVTMREANKHPQLLRKTYTPDTLIGKI